MCFPFYFEYLDGLVGGTGGQSPAVVVQDRIVLYWYLCQLSQSLFDAPAYGRKTSEVSKDVDSTYDHVIVTGIRYYLSLI